MTFGPLRLVFALLLVLAGCAQAHNYSDPSGPRYVGSYAEALAVLEGPLRVVTFNVKFGERTKRATKLLDEHPRLRDADIILLQEMDAEGTDEIAAGLKMNYVYYPAVTHAKSDRDFGNAVLSRWPILEDEKLILPHLATFDRSQRIATRATLRIGEEEVRVYSLHLATPLELSEGSRKDQARAVREDAEPWQGRVIVGGDFNDRDMAKVFFRGGYAWPTDDIGNTNRWSSVDHIVARGYNPLDYGKVKKNADASDHKPVWAEFGLD